MTFRLYPDKMKKQRILAIVLSAVVFLSTQGITVFAGTEKGDGSAGGTEQFQNPQHHCNGSWGDREGDSTDWSYVNFGSYPQTEIPEENLTSEVTEASYNEQGDAMVNGVKYRRISKENTVSSDNFGDRSFRYFKWEPLKWRVLKNDGSTLFLMADKGIDCRKFHETYENVIWETSSIRQWLSGTFYPEAFSAREQAVIQEQPTGEGMGQPGILRIRYIFFLLKRHSPMAFVNIENPLQAEVCIPVSMPMPWGYLPGMVITIITGVTGGFVLRGILTSRIWDTVQHILTAMGLFTDWVMIPVMTWG